MDINNLNTKKGVIALMYHRFEENKYPSTNIRNEIFLEQKKRIYNALKNSDSDSVIKFKNVLSKIINE